MGVATAAREAADIDDRADLGAEHQAGEVLGRLCPVADSEHHLRIRGDPTVDASHVPSLDP